MSEYRDVPIEDVSPNPRNPRESFDEGKIEELAESIDAKGLLQPVLARPNGDGYELVHGERRFRAVKKLGHDTIKAEVRELDDREALEISITENLQREDVSPIAEARSYQQLIDGFDLTQTEAAERLGVSQGNVANQLKLLKLPEILQRDILHKILTPWQARIIGQHWGDYRLRDFVIDHDLSVKELRDVVSQLNDGKKWIAIHDTFPVDTFEGDIKTGPIETTGNDGETVRSDGGVQNARIWADKHGYWEYEREFEAGPQKGKRVADHRDPEPVVFSYVHNAVVKNYTLIALAEDYDHEGEIQTKIIFPQSFFDWVEFPDSGIEGERGGGSA